jgi:16S rRNA (guanine(966)-N(2))-methyltransferase RsmD
MRVIAGLHGGRRLSAPAGRATRPTSDRVREALFSILADVSGARVLDLFAGSGALAIEALSRGAASATLVDSGRGAIAAITRNLRELDLAADIHRVDAVAFLRTACRDGRQYDLIFLDPPYDRAGGLRAVLSVGLSPVLAPAARVVTESDRRDPLALDLPLLDERTYGDTVIQIHGTR